MTRFTLPRRPLPLLAALAALPIRAGAVPGLIRFQIRREGSVIGTHRVSFSDAADGQAALTEVMIAVRIAGITVFRLTHRFEEVWADGRLRRAQSRRDRNGRVTEFSARAEAGAVVIDGPAGRARLPATAAPLSWWDPARLDGPALFDTETGAALDYRWERTARPGGGTRWRSRNAAGTEDSESEYAADGTWLSWRTRAEDASTVTYERA